MSTLDLFVGSSKLPEIPINNFTHQHSFTFKGGKFGWVGIKSMAYSSTLNRAIAIGDYSRLMYSNDGLNWTETDSLYSAVGGYAPFIEVLWTGSSFIALATTFQSSQKYIYRSTDGINWTLQYSVADGGTFATMDGNSSILLMVSRGAIHKSTNDGVTWSNVYASSNMSSLAWTTTYDIVYHEIVYYPTLGRFLLIGADASSAGDAYGNSPARGIYTSDGITWTASTSAPYISVRINSKTSLPSTAKGIYGCNFSQDATYTPPSVLYSTNGTSYSRYTATNDVVNTPVGAQVYSLHNDGTNFVAWYGTYFATSPVASGTTWTMNATNIGLQAGGDAVYHSSSGYGSIGGPKGRIARHSAGNYTFSLYTSSSGSWGIGAINGSAYAESIDTIVTVGQTYGTTADGPTQLFNVSTNGGIDWTTVSSPTNVTWYDVVYANNIFVAVGASGYVATSTNGTTWNLQNWLRGTTWAATAVNSIAWNGSVFCAVGAAGKVATSTDGVSWTYVGAITTIAFSKIRWNGSVFCAVGASGAVWVSSNGVSWTDYTSAAGFSTTTVSCVASDDLGKLVIAGGTTTPIVKYSTDNGVSWSTSTATGTVSPASLYWDGYKFILGGGVGSTNSMIPQTSVSTDGVTFTANTTATTGSISNVIGNKLKVSILGGYIASIVKAGSKIFAFTSKGLCGYTTYA